MSLDITALRAYMHKKQGAQTSEIGYLFSCLDKVAGYDLLSGVQEFIDAFGGYAIEWDRMYYRAWRYELKKAVNALGGGNEQAGFDLLTNEQKFFCSQHNIGTALQRLNAIPNHFERDEACFDFFCRNEGVDVKAGNVGSKYYGALMLKALAFSRCDHILVSDTPLGKISMSGFLYSMLDIIPKPDSGELSGNALELYKSQGVDGVALGGLPVGISDMIAGTSGTRYEKDSLWDSATIQAVVAADKIGIAGYGNTPKDIQNFAKDMMFIVKFGFAPWQTNA